MTDKKPQSDRRSSSGSVRAAHGIDPPREEETRARADAHPLIRMGRRTNVLGFAIIALGVLLAAPLVFAGLFGPAVVGLMMSMLGVFLLANGNVLSTLGRSTPVLNAAMDAIARGKLDEAEQLHATLPPNIARQTFVMRVLESQRAMIALGQGDASAAAKHASACTDARTGLFTRGYEHVHRAEGWAWRALASAALGETDLVESDAKAVEASTHARAPACARVALARAIVISRGDHRTKSGDNSNNSSSSKAALRAYLAEHGDNILEYTLPRERSLVRALKRLASSPAKSVYREPTRPEDDDAAEEAKQKNKLRSWIAQVAPDAAAFAPEETFVAAADAADVAPLSRLAPLRADEEALRQIAASRSSAAKPIGSKSRSLPLTLALWALLVVSFVALWQFLTPSEKTETPFPSPPPIPDEDPHVLWTFAPAAVAFVFAITVLWKWIGHHRKLERELLEAERMIAFGDRPAGTAKAQGLAKSRLPIIAAGAQLQLATLAIRAGDFSGAVAEADRGIAKIGVTPATRAIAADLYTPSLIGERAFALAALDRLAEAETEIATMIAAYPSYPFMARAIFRVRLMMAVRRNERAECVRLAMSRTPDLPIDLRTDLLADAVLAASGGPIGNDERSRIATELRDQPEIEAWIDRVAGHITKGAPPPKIRIKPPREEDEPKNEDDDYYYEDDVNEEQDAQKARLPS